MDLAEAVHQYFIAPAFSAKLFVLGIVIMALFLRTKTVTACFFSVLSLHRRKILLAILIIGFLLRAGWVMWSPRLPGGPHSEDLNIMRHAVEIYEGKGFILPNGVATAGRTIGYSVFVSQLYRLSGGENIRLVEAVNVLLGVAGIALIYLVGFLLSGPAVGLFSSLILAICPTSILSTKIYLDEHLFIPLFLGGLAFLIADYKKPRILWLIYGGLLMGLSAQCRTFSFLMGLVVFFAWLVGKRSLRRALSRGLFVQLLILMIALPWAYRNYVKMNAPIFYTSLFGLALYYGNNPNPNLVTLSLEQGGDKEFLLAKSEPEQNRAGVNAALKWIKAHPQEFVSRTTWKILYHLGLNREQWVITDNFYRMIPARAVSKKLINILSRIDQGYYAVMFMLALIALGMLAREKAEAGGFLLIIIFIAYYLAMIGVAIPPRKYRFVIEHMFFLLAAFSLTRLVYKSKERA